jgi:putative tryptophan/tyrosine transport system substrate-binding protein
MRRREFIATLGGAVVWPVVAGAQGSMPVVAFIDPGDSNGDAPLVAAFRKGLNDTGFVDGTNVTIEIHWLQGKFDRVSALTAELVGRQVAAIASTTPGALAAKAATSTIPIVFASGGDPVKLGLVASLNRPSGNVTGVSFFGALMESKRLGLLHEMVPQARSVTVLLNPSNPVIDTQLREVDLAAHTLGLQLDVHRAGTDSDLDAGARKCGGVAVDGAGAGYANHRCSNTRELRTIMEPVMGKNARSWIQRKWQRSVRASYGARKGRSAA